MTVRNRLEMSRTPIADVFIATTDPIGDHRGLFARLYCERELFSAVGNRRIVQINISRTAQMGAVRGLHFQPRMTKLVRCLRGRAWDVVVDLRRGSPTFLQWHAEELTPENWRMLIIPGGCAQGFQALDPGTELLYLHTDFYSPESEGGVSCVEPRIGVRWPLPIADLSSRDRSFPPLALDFQGVQE
jgi:dTDP-4-dehydrorhamnose 3,5-epimerase